MSMKMGIPGFVPMVAISGEDITEIYSTLTIITSHVPHPTYLICTAIVQMEMFYRPIWPALQNPVSVIPNV